ncbi:DUF3596 domain-containing protein [Pantoea sp. EA-12]|uniref:Arm DNA-binding domain-containing protein n=1 Tax=Pantoea sp. EA-12 TaxID=3043303 RepID=UPI0024B556E7|nr:DUF3596 domain-containing protein [Pantoea sp. EA-12]MDI9222078.1 DUF3596 domain-containing protein [Pantoea sp. EA-12]
MAALPTGVEIRNKSICIWFMYRGKRCRETLKGWINTPANIKKAGSLRTIIVSEINLGEFNYHERFPGSSRLSQFDTTQKIETFGDLIDMWMEGKKPEVSANTLKGYISTARVVRRIVGDETPIKNIRHNDILFYRSEFLNGMTLYAHGSKQNRKGRKVRTVQSYMQMLGRVMDFACRCGFIEDKPHEGIKPLKRIKGKPDPLLKHELKQLIIASRGQAKNLWPFAVYSGLRHGELAALAWEDVDLDRGVIHIRRNLTSVKQFGPPKTNAGIRTVHLLKPAIAALRAQLELTGHKPPIRITFHPREYGKTEEQNVRFVFVPNRLDQEEKPWFSTSGISSRWDAAIKRAGIRRRTPYQTRHTYACWMLSAGANPTFIATQMGHENAQMVYDVYGSWIGELSGSQVDMLNTVLAI